MRERQRNSTLYHIPLLFVDATDHITGKTGLSPQVWISKNCGNFVAASGAITEIGSGSYKYAAHASDRDTLGELEIHGYAAGADPVDLTYVIVPWDPFDGKRLGLGCLPNADPGAASGFIVAEATAQQLPANAITSGAIRSDAGFWLADLLLTRDWTQIWLPTPARSLWNALRFLRNKWSVSGGTLTVMREDDSTTAWTASVSGTTGADPITGVDPG